MPKNAKRRRSSKNHGKRGLSEASKKKLDTIGEEAEEETLEGLLSDFDIQSKWPNINFIINSVSSVSAVESTTARRCDCSLAPQTPLLVTKVS